MKNTLANNKQLFNVKAIGDAVTLDALADGEFGVFAKGATTSIAAATAFAALPDEFRFVAKLDGKVYYSFDTIKKTSMLNIAESPYVAPVVNIWEAEVASSECDCISAATLRIGLDEESLMRERGLSWVNMDNTVVNSPTELTSACDCTGNPTYDNHIITQELYNKVNNSDSPFYLAKVRYDVTGLTTYADDTARDAAIPTPAGGEVVLHTANAAMQVYDLATTAWIDVAPLNGYFTSAALLQSFITATKVLNTDETAGTDTGKIIFVLEGKPATVRNYKDLDVNYIYPRGVKLSPAITLNGGDGPSIVFTETQDIVYEVNAGADLRAEEFECMSLYTNLNHYPQLHDGIAAEDLVFQFENGSTYSSINFEFSTDKVNRNDGDKRNFNILLATDSGAVYAELQNMFIA
jgi:hypothetical protein